MGAAPLRAPKRRSSRIGKSGRPKGPEAWERWLPRIGEIADGIGAIVGAPPGSVFLGPNVSVLQAAIATCLDFVRRTQRSRLRGAAVSVGHVRLAENGSATARACASCPPTTDARFQPNASSPQSRRRRRSPFSRTRTTSRARSRTSERSKRTAAASARCSASTHIRPPACYPYDVTEWDLDLVTGGSHKWLCGGPGCGLIYVKPSLLERFSPAVTGWMAHERPFAFEAAPIEHARSMYRFGTGTPTIPGYVVAKPGHDFIRAGRRGEHPRA